MVKARLLAGKGFPLRWSGFVCIIIIIIFSTTTIIIIVVVVRTTIVWVQSGRHLSSNTKHESDRLIPWCLQSAQI